jgi:hypothetical protein
MDGIDDQDKIADGKPLLEHAAQTARSISGDTLSGTMLSKKRWFSCARCSSVTLHSSRIIRCIEDMVSSADRFDLTTSIRWVDSTSIGVTTVAPAIAASSCESGPIQRAGLP